MTYTSHGHHIDGTPLVESERPSSVARCGGPALCRTCSREAALAKVRGEVELPVEPPEAIPVEHRGVIYHNDDKQPWSS